MFETFMKNGSFRVDYLNEPARGSPEALAMYVCGDLPNDESYSRSAKHQLLAGLDRVSRFFGRQNLVAVYMDICAGESTNRPAYEQLKKDLADGFFRRVFLYCGFKLFENQPLREDLAVFCQQIGGFEIFACKPELEAPQPVLVTDLLAAEPTKRSKPWAMQL